MLDRRIAHHAEHVFLGHLARSGHRGLVRDRSLVRRTHSPPARLGQTFWTSHSKPFLVRIHPSFQCGTSGYCSFRQRCGVGSRSRGQDSEYEGHGRTDNGSRLNHHQRSRRHWGFPETLDMRGLFLEAKYRATFKVLSDAVDERAAD